MHRTLQLEPYKIRERLCIPEFYLPIVVSVKAGQGGRLALIVRDERKSSQIVVPLTRAQGIEMTRASLVLVLPVHATHTSSSMQHCSPTKHIDTKCKDN